MTSKSDKLPDLLVVLAITVVLAAVLLPAVTSSHGNEVSAESSVAEERPVMDGHVGPTTATAQGREELHDSREAAREPAVFVETGTDSATVEPVAPVQATGLKEMRTTDISYVIP